MGFGLPAAMGAKVAHPDHLCIDIDGDGSFLMNVQELACCHTEHIPAKVLLLNNQHLGMVVQWEDRFFGSATAGIPTWVRARTRPPYPDFAAVATGFGIPARTVTDKADLDAALIEMIESPGAFVLNVMVPHQEHVLPMIPVRHDGEGHDQGVTAAARVGTAPPPGRGGFHPRNPPRPGGSTSGRRHRPAG